MPLIGCTLYKNTEADRRYYVFFSIFVPVYSIQTKTIIF